MSDGDIQGKQFPIPPLGVYFVRLERDGEIERNYWRDRARILEVKARLDGGKWRVDLKWVAKNGIHQKSWEGLDESTARKLTDMVAITAEAMVPGGIQNLLEGGA